MKRLLVYTREFTVNIEATEIKIENDKVFAYKNEMVVGIFDTDIVQAMYLSTVNGKTGECNK